MRLKEVANGFRTSSNLCENAAENKIQMSETLSIIIFQNSYGFSRQNPEISRKLGQSDSNGPSVARSLSETPSLRGAMSMLSMLEEARGSSMPERFSGGTRKSANRFRVSSVGDSTISSIRSQI